MSRSGLGLNFFKYRHHSYQVFVMFYITTDSHLHDCLCSSKLRHWLFIPEPLIYYNSRCLRQILVAPQGSKMKWAYHYEDLSMQCIEIFLPVKKNENSIRKKNDIFNIFAQNIDCGYTLEPPRRGGSNEYPQSMFWSKNKKNRYTPANPSFCI